MAVDVLEKRILACFHAARDTRESVELEAQCWAQNMLSVEVPMISSVYNGCQVQEGTTRGSVMGSSPDTFPMPVSGSFNGDKRCWGFLVQNNNATVAVFIELLINEAFGAASMARTGEIPPIASGQLI
jgi:hypothetical protein